MPTFLFMDSKGLKSQEIVGADEAKVRRCAALHSLLFFFAVPSLA